MRSINLFHILVVAPLLLAVAILRHKTPNWLYDVLLAVGTLGMVYHIYKYYNTGNNLNLFHVVAVFPLLIFIGLLKGKTPSYAFLLLFALGIVVLYYHGLQLAKSY